MEKPARTPDSWESVRKFVQIGSNQEGQPVGSSFLCCCPQVVWRVQRCFTGSGLPSRELQCLGSFFFTCFNCGLWCNLNSTRPFHSFGSPGRVFAKVKKVLSLTVTVDPSLYILYVTLSPVNRDICVGRVLEAPIRGSSISFLCLDVPDPFQLWLIHFPGIIREIMSSLYALGRSKQGTNLLQIVNANELSCKSDMRSKPPMHQALRSRQQNQSNNSLAISPHSGMRNDSRCQVRQIHQCTVSHNRYNNRQY